VDDEALAAAASLLAETTDVQDEAVLAADGWTDSSANKEGADSEKPEDNGFSEKSEDDESSEPPETELYSDGE